jgi:hypothetical protein
VIVFFSDYEGNMRMYRPQKTTESVEFAMLSVKSGTPLAAAFRMYGTPRRAIHGY